MLIMRKSYRFKHFGQRTTDFVPDGLDTSDALADATRRVPTGANYSHSNWQISSWKARQRFMLSTPLVSMAKAKSSPLEALA